MEETTFQEDMKLDFDALDKEWWKQPILYAKYSKLSAAANARAARAEEKVKTVRSDLTLRFIAEAKDGKAPPSHILEALYRTHPDHLKAKEEWLAAKEEADLLQQALWALGHRKDALENATKLYLSQYFMGSTAVPHELGDWSGEVDKSRQEAVREAVRSRQGGRTR